MANECIQCGKEVASGSWEVGQVIVANNFFACSSSCGILWANDNCTSGAEVEEAFQDELGPDVKFRVVHTVS